MARHLAGFTHPDDLAVGPTPDGPWHRELDPGSARPDCNPDAGAQPYSTDVTLVPAGHRCGVCWINVQHVAR